MIGQNISEIQDEEFYFANAVGERFDERVFLRQSDGIPRQIERVQIAATQAGRDGVQISGEGQKMILGDEVVAQVQAPQGGKRGERGRGDLC